MQTNFYTPSEVGEILKVSAKTIIRLIDQQKLSAYKIGKQYRISEDHVNQYIKSRTLKAKKLKIAI